MAKATTTARLSAAIAVAFDMPQMSYRPDELPPSERRFAVAAKVAHCFSINFLTSRQGRAFTI